MRTFLSTLALVALLGPSAAAAQFLVGARLGVAFPYGDADANLAMKDLAKNEIPIQLDLGLKLGQAMEVGLYGGIAPAQPGGDLATVCDTFKLDCTVFEVRVGAQLNLHAVNTENTEFWGGVSAGIVQGTWGYTILGTEFANSVTGFEGALQGGLDFRLSPLFRAGPYASLSVAQYNQRDTGSGAEDIPEKGTHGFFTIGVRGLIGR